MAPRKKKPVDMEVQEVQEVLPKEGEVTPPNPEPPVPPKPEPPVETTTIRLNVEFHRIDAIMAELASEKPLSEAIKVDAELSALFETNGDLIVRESRDSRYIRFKNGVDAKFTANSDGIWTEPVSYTD